MRWVHLVFAVLFGVSALLQYNDPDPVRWALVWGAAAALAAWGFRGRAHPLALSALAAVAAAWMALLAPAMVAFMQLGDLGLLTATMQAEQPLIEEAREFLGLAIILLYCLGTVALRRA